MLRCSDVNVGSKREILKNMQLVGNGVCVCFARSILRLRPINIGTFSYLFQK